jgi:HAD superfamily hydrolase (TIGR01490 family)
MSETNPPIVAAFDLDGTLTQGGSVFPWLRFIAGRRQVYRAALPLLVPLTIGAIRSGRWADNAKERLFHKLLVGRDLGELTVSSRVFALEHLEHEGRAKVLARLEWHREQGHDIVVVSASPQIYVDVIADALRATGALGTRLAVDARSKLTGSYLGKNCRGTEKMRRLSEWIEQRHYASQPIVYAYGNSRGDRRLLAGATYPFDAGKLGWLGSLRRYPRLKAEKAEKAESPTTAE